MTKRRSSSVLCAVTILLIIAAHQALGQLGIYVAEGKSKAYETFANELFCDAEPLVVASEPAELEKMLEEERITVAILRPLNYIHIRTRTPLTLVARLEKFGLPVYSSMIYADFQHVKSPAHLENMQFCYFSDRSASGYLYPLWMLKKAKVNVRTTKQLGTGHKSVLDHVLNNSEQSFGGIWSSGYQLADPKLLSGVNLYEPLGKSEEEIVHDAIVVNGKLDPDEQAPLIEVINTLIKKRRPELKQKFPGTGITGVVSAEDKDFDPIREVHAEVKEQLIVRLGLSLNLTPNTDFTKKRGWRVLQEYFFAKHDTFLKVEVYPRGDFDRMLRDLENNDIDIAELPPIPAGQAMKNGLDPLVTPVFRSEEAYNAFLIQKVGEGVVYPQGLMGRKIALSQESSASGYAYPKWKLETHEDGFDLDDDHIIQFDGEELQVVQAVATDADFGAIAEYKLCEYEAKGLISVRDTLSYCKDNKKSDNPQVAVVPQSRVVIPMGAYILSRELSGPDESSQRVRLRNLFKESYSKLEEVAKTSPEVVARMPRFEDVDSERIITMKEVYDHNVKTPILVWILISAIALILVAGCLFFIVFPRTRLRTHSEPK